MGKKLDRVSSTLAGILRSRGMQGRLEEYRIFGQWEKTVGGLVASHARPATMRGSKLFLTVDSPAWMQQLSLLKPEIIEKVNRGLGKDVVRDIALTLGEVPKAEHTPPLRRSFRAELTPDERTRIEDAVAEIRDPEVQAAFRRVMEKDVLSRKGNRM
jgi:predicted nucleic acid-binding Zn ribbon protein